MDGLHPTVLANEKGSRPAVEVGDLRKGCGQLVGCSGEQHRIGDAVSMDHGAKAGGILMLRGFFEAELDDLEAAVVVFAVERFEEGRFVLAVGAPAATDRDDHCL